MRPAAFSTTAALDVLVSDQAPETMIPVAYALAAAGRLPWTDTIQLVSTAPAAVAGLPDRGRPAHAPTSSQSNAPVPDR
jgi:alpha-D-ribose 1-methylphosphonate 5-triphosphate diphosphatase PhnM